MSFALKQLWPIQSKAPQNVKEAPHNLTRKMNIGLPHQIRKSSSSALVGYAFQERLNAMEMQASEIMEIMVSSLAFHPVTNTMAQVCPTMMQFYRGAKKGIRASYVQRVKMDDSSTTKPV